MKSTNSFDFHERRKKRFLLTGAFGAGGLFYFGVWLPLTGIGIPCVFREITGLYCPGCGMTRLVISLLELDPVQAFRYNMLAFFLAPMYLIYLKLARSGKTRLSSVLAAVMVAMTVAFGVLRNLPHFAWLAPAAT